MNYLAEFVGSLILLLSGYAYTCNISLKKTLVSKLNYIELAVAWSLAVGLGVAVAKYIGGPAYMNPGVVFGNILFGGLALSDALIYLLMEFLATGASELICMVFFWDSFKASGDAPKRGIFSAYPVEKNIPLNVVQEIMATFFFFFLLLTLTSIPTGEMAPLVCGAAAFAVVMILALSLNSTGFSMNAMRSVFSSVWFVLIPFPNKNGEKVDWQYQLTVNLAGSSIGAILAVLVVGLL